MKKWAVGAGILLFVVAAGLLGSHNVPVTAYATQLAGSKDEPTGEWEYSGNFSRGDIIMVDIYQNIFWSENVSEYDVIDGIPTLWIDLNITDPSNTVSTFELQYTYQQTDVEHRLLAYNLTVVSVGTGIDPTAPISETGVTFIAGTAKLNGTYVADITSVGSDILEYRVTNLKPGYFTLWKAVAHETYPYEGLLYVGFAAIPAGFIFAAYGLKKNERISKKRTKSEAAKT
jgi:hypothetical protein